MRFPATKLVRSLLLAGAALAAWAAPVRAEPILSELMAANTKTLADEDGAFSDWVEIHNPDPVPADLGGWFLTDNPSNKTKWQFPAVTVPAGGYLIVFASNKNRRDPAGTLHTNFALSAAGEYLGLIKPDGSTVASEFAPEFPAQLDDVSYGRVALEGGGSESGFLRKPTPGAANGGRSDLLLVETVAFSRASGPFNGTIRVELAGAGPGQKIRYELAAGTGAVNAEPTALSAEYTGPLTLNTTALVKAAVFSADDSVRGLTASAHYLKIGATAAGFASQLPVLILDNLGAGGLVKDGIDHASWLYGYEPATSGPGVFASGPGVATPATSTVRGSSSADFPKKGYNLKLRDELGNKRSAPLFDLPAAERWALTAPWAFDQNYVNNAFVYALSNRLGRWAPRTRLAEVFFNADGGNLESADYAGIYVLTERIEIAANRVDVARLSPNDTTEPAITGGYILKLDPKDPDEIGWTTNRGVPDNGSSSVVLVAPGAGDVAPAQVDYIRDYVQRMEDALHADREGGFAQRTYLDFIDRDSWIDHHLLNVLVSNPDAFVRSAYFTKPRNGRLQAGPVWDFDRALGAFWDDRSAVVNTWSGNNAAVDFWRTGWWGVLAQDPEFMQDWIDRWQSLRRTEFSTRNLTSLLQGFADSVGPAAAARDAARWPDNASPYGSYAAQIEKTKTWLTERAAWIDRQFVAAPAMSESGGTLTFTAPAGAVLAYTLDGSDPRSLGGAVAPNAILTSSALTVPATANVHVRSYKSDMNAFPGSPWSAAVGGAASSPLSPKARLVNISTRGRVGNFENPLIVGVVIADTATKPVLTRAIGPTLAQFGATGTVPDPQLSLVNSEGVELFRNNGWETGPDAARLPALARAVGAFPLAAGAADSALANPLGRGAYTVQITSPSGQGGIGLAELYELDGNGRAVNLSTRAYVGTGGEVLIGGFVVQGPAHKRMLIRAVGPTLSAFGLDHVLADPVLTLYSGQTIVATNDRWSAGADAAVIENATKAVGGFALVANGEDAALLITVPPGAYTVEVRGKNGGEGIGLLEIYEVP